MGINVLSLFDGISCGMVALERAGINVDKYYASEIKKSAIRCSLHNYPNIIQIGDIKKIYYKKGVLYTEKGNFQVGKIHLMIGGSPCQDFSNARILSKKSIDGLQGDKSCLFYEFLRLLKEVEPEYFLLENVRMKKQGYNQLNEYLGVKGIRINSNLVSYQNRDRYYWTNIPNVKIPNDKNIDFQKYKDNDQEYCSQFKVKRTPSREKMWNNGIKESISNCKNITYSKKIGCITRKQDRSPNSGLIEFQDFCRYLTRREIELAQTLPIGYTDCLSYSQMQDVCGDAWTVDVIAHILKYIGDKYESISNE